MTEKPKFAWNKIFNIAAALPAVCGVGTAIFLGYLLLWPTEPVYQPNKTSDHRAYYDGFIRIHRLYCVNDAKPITITTDLIKIGNDNEPQMRISLPISLQVYEIGCHTIDRIIDVPRSTPAGEYKIAGVATWQANPFRIGTVELPQLFITIPPREEREEDRKTSKP